MRSLMPPTAALLALLCLASAACSGSGQSCNVMAWQHGVGINLDPPISGTGTVEVRVTDKVSDPSCDFSLAESAIAHCDTGWASTSDGQRSVISAGPDSIGLAYAERSDLPESLVLTLTVDGVTTDYTLTPDYEVDEPNGEGCGERQYATLTLTR
jgi:hypothetical protein